MPWLPTRDWPDDIVVALACNHVRIVAIYTNQRGEGAFSRLITGIAQAGLRPTIICPTAEMADICKAWGWRQRFIGSTFKEREEQWFPPKKWLKQRAAA